MERSELPPHKSATYVLPRGKVVYVAVPKAACTSIKWLIADLQGENREAFYNALTPEVTRATTIHRRPQWRRTPMLHRLADEELAEISPERGWFVFTVIRHPSARLWSAWQSKLLLREPRWVRRFGTEPWFPRVPSTSSDIVEDFQRFVCALAENPDQQIMRDRHFLSQSRLVTPERTPYTRIYETGEIDELLQDLATQLRRHGWDGSLSLDATNETPLRPLAVMFSSEVVDAITAVYGEDFERFGYENVLPDALDPADQYGEAALLEIRRLLERAERIGDLVVKARRLQGQNKAQRQEIRELRSELNGRSAGTRLDGGLARKVRRRMSRALSRA